MGFPDPCSQSSLPVFRRIQAGIKQLRVTELPHQQWIILPITLPVLRAFREQLDTVMGLDLDLIGIHLHIQAKNFRYVPPM